MFEKAKKMIGKAKAELEKHQGAMDLEGWKKVAEEYYKKNKAAHDKVSE